MKNSFLISNLKRFWGAYKERIYVNCTELEHSENTLQYWRNDLFAATLTYLMPLCLIALVPGFYLAVTEGAIFLVIADLIAVVSSLTIAFVPGISVYLRKIVFFISLILISVALLYYLGTFGPGLMYLLAITVFVVLIFDKKYGYGAVAFNTVVCIGFAVAIYFDWWTSELFTVYDLKDWIGISTNLIFLSFLSVLLIPKLFNGLEDTIREQHRLGNELETNQTKLENSLLEVESKNKKLKDSNNEKEVLLAEIHHRVKNNLAIVSGLMQIQAYNVENEEVERKLEDSMFRIRTMASIHELLYQSKNFSYVNVSGMLRKLSTDINQAMKGDKKIDIEIDEEPVQLNINQAIPCALMINEVLTNAFKHAFVNRKSGRIQLQVKSNGDEVTINVQDNGVGIQESETNSSSLGIQLLEILTNQLNGENRYFGTGNGTHFSVKFIKKNTKGSASTIVL
ncbi:MAG: sensor histidine kinase [Balneolaceae bacterium]